MHVRLELPIIRPMQWDCVELQIALYDAMTAEICDAVEYLIKTRELNTSNLVVSLENRTESTTEKQIIARELDWLLIDFNLTTKQQIDKPEYEVYLVATDAEDLAIDLIYAVNISKPGSMHTDNCRILVERHEMRHHISKRTLEIHEALRRMEPRGWPPIQNLPIRTAIDWFALDGDWLPDLGGATARSRAFNAYTYLIGSPPEMSNHEILLYSMIGLESIYSSGGDKIAEAIDSRVQLVVGELISFKKTLKSMYNQRSKFVHGALPFPSRDRAINAADQSTHEISLIEASETACIVLVSTLQVLAHNRAREVIFTTEKSFR